MWKTILYWVCKVVKFIPKAKAFIKTMDELKELKELKDDESLSTNWRKDLPNQIK